jgi:hypothetical protein
VHSDAVGKTRIYARRRLVDMATAQRHQPDGELPKVRLGESDVGAPLQASPAVDPDAVSPVDEHVGDLGVSDQSRQDPEFADVHAVSYRHEWLSRPDRLAAAALSHKPPRDRWPVVEWIAPYFELCAVIHPSTLCAMPRSEPANRKHGGPRRTQNACEGEACEGGPN